MFLANQGNNIHLDHLATGSVLFDIRRKRISGQLKKEELEEEVSNLRKMLKQEENVHEILEHIKNKTDGSSISIPSFLPPKMKELLAELAMVEGEIARLESQISQLQNDIKQEQKITKETKSKQQQPPPPPSPPGTPNNFPGFWYNSSNDTRNPISTPARVHFVKKAISPNPSPMRSSRPSDQDRLVFDTKALHFISKAIKGDFMNGLRSNHDTHLNDKVGYSTPKIVVDHKDNGSIQQGTTFQDRVPRKTGLVASPSPLRDPRNPSPKPREQRNTEKSSDFLPKALSNTILTEENAHQWQPNKLSENIMKCLNFIYIRLLRTSRAMELEKSGPITRALNTSLIARSFRADTSTSSLSNSLVFQRDSRQQDPYGIFNVEESVLRDVGPYKNLVIFTSSSLDPKCISSSSSITLLRKLRVLMSNLQNVDLRFLTHQQKLAFWINMYNACIMHGFLQYGVPSSPEKLFTLINKATLNIGGNMINSHEIEHYILRKPTSSDQVESNEKDKKEDIVRKLYGFESTDPNITFALCCGTRSSPAVKIYTGEGVTTELEKSKLEYLQASIVVTNTKRIAFPELLLRNLLDFAMDTDSLVEWVCHQLPTSGSLRKSIVDCFRALNNNNNSGKIPTISVEKIPYDFEFQYLLAM